MTPPLWQKVKRTKKPLDESWLKAQHSENEDHGIQSHHLMGNRWGNSGTVSDFIFLGSKITTDGDCSHEIKRRLLLGRKVMTNLDSIFGEGNGNPLQYSCLENPMDGGATSSSSR